MWECGHGRQRSQVTVSGSSARPVDSYQMKQTNRCLASSISLIKTWLHCFGLVFVSGSHQAYYYPSISYCGPRLVVCNRVLIHLWPVCVILLNLWTFKVVFSRHGYCLLESVIILFVSLLVSGVYLVPRSFLSLQVEAVFVPSCCEQDVWSGVSW